MAERPKKKRKAKVEAAAAEAGGGEGIFGSVAELLSKGAPAPGEGQAKQEGGSVLKAQYSRLFGSGGGGLFGAGAQASQLPRTPSASSAAAPRSTPTPTTPAEAIASRKRGRSSEPATSSTAGKAADAKGEKGGKDRPGGEKSGPRFAPLTREEKKEAESRRVFIGNVPLDWSEKRLRSALREAVGDKYEGKMKPIWFRSEPLKVRWVFGKRWKDGHKIKDYAEGVSDAKNGYAELDSPEAVHIVSKAVHGFKADETHILRGDAVGEAAKLLTFDRKRSIFVGNLPSNTTEADLRQAFGPAGAIDAVRVVRDKESKMCKGIAFVRFEKRTSLKAAFELWPWPEVKGRELRVKQVTDQSEQGKVQAHRDWEMTPAARRILMKEQRKLRSKVNKAVTKQKEAAKEMGKRPGKRTKGKRVKGPKSKGGKKAKK